MTSQNDGRRRDVQLLHDVLHPHLTIGEFPVLLGQPAHAGHFPGLPAGPRRPQVPRVRRVR